MHRKNQHRASIAIPKGQAGPIRLIGNGAIASPDVGDGRMIPVLRFAANDRPDIVELVRMHRYSPPGDVVVAWAAFKWSKSKSTLVIHFTSPTNLYILIDFNVETEHALVELILSAKALYLQPGSEEDDGLTKLQGDRILIEVPDTGFGEHWRPRLFRYLRDHFRKEGFSAKEAVSATNRYLEQTSKIKDLRRPTAYKITEEDLSKVNPSEE